mmetsp:Transcript_3488/g.10143  ORF Transcript_3488/g.10143 Transcript_3488/m.10143 type:complete len:322 (-) Transcript_3488:1756-2721(-)
MALRPRSSAPSGTSSACPSRSPGSAPLRSSSRARTSRRTLAPACPGCAGPRPRARTFLCCRRMRTGTGTTSWTASQAGSSATTAARHWTEPSSRASRMPVASSTSGWPWAWTSGAPRGRPCTSHPCSSGPTVRSRACIRSTCSGTTSTRSSSPGTSPIRSSTPSSAASACSSARTASCPRQRASCRSWAPRCCSTHSTAGVPTRCGCTSRSGPWRTGSGTSPPTPWETPTAPASSGPGQAALRSAPPTARGPWPPRRRTTWWWPRSGHSRPSGSRPPGRTTSSLRGGRSSTALSRGRWTRSPAPRCTGPRPRRCRLVARMC